MPLPSFASLDDYTDRFGPVDDETRAEAAIADASTRMRAAVGVALVDDDGNLEFPESSQPWAADVFLAICCQIANRRLTNPDGIESEAIDGYTRSLGNISPDAYIRKSEREDLLSALGRTSAGAFSIDTVGCLTANHAEVCALNFGALYCSCGSDIAGFPLYENDPL